MGAGTSGTLRRRIARAGRIRLVAHLACGHWVVVVCGYRAGIRGCDRLVRNGAAAGQNAVEQADAKMRHKLSGVTLNAIMELNLIIALALAFGIGLSLGLLGSGGSIVTLPVLVYVAGVACGATCRRGALGFPPPDPT